MRIGWRPTVQPVIPAWCRSPSGLPQEGRGGGEQEALSSALAVHPFLSVEEVLYSPRNDYLAVTIGDPAQEDLPDSEREVTAEHQESALQWAALVNEHFDELPTVEVYLYNRGHAVMAD